MAMKKIGKGEEITFDYAMGNYVVESFTMECRCGSGLCRKKITGWKGLPEERKEEYKGYVLKYLLEIDRRENKEE